MVDTLLPLQTRCLMVLYRILHGKSSRSHRLVVLPLRPLVAEQESFLPCSKPFPNGTRVSIGDPEAQLGRLKCLHSRVAQRQGIGDGI